MSASGGSFGLGWIVALVGLALVRGRQFSRSAMGIAGALVVALLLTGCGGDEETALYFVHSDHLGTPEVVTDKDKAPVWEGQKDPFGKTHIVSNTIDFNVRFPGQYYDEESGLHYNLMRYYDPNTGRYLQSDPIGILSDYSEPQLQITKQMEIVGLQDVQKMHHLYGYANQNPLAYIDPLTNSQCYLDCMAGPDEDPSCPGLPAGSLIHEFVWDISCQNGEKVLRCTVKCEKKDC